MKLVGVRASTYSLEDVKVAAAPQHASNRDIQTKIDCYSLIHRGAESRYNWTSKHMEIREIFVLHNRSMPSPENGSKHVNKTIINLKSGDNFKAEMTRSQYN